MRPQLQLAVPREAGSGVLLPTCGVHLHQRAQRPGLPLPSHHPQLRRQPKARASGQAAPHRQIQARRGPQPEPLPPRGLSLGHRSRLPGCLPPKKELAQQGHTGP